MSSVLQKDPRIHPRLLRTRTNHYRALSVRYVKEVPTAKVALFL
jgi:hypothetical protein